MASDRTSTPAGKRKYVIRELHTARQRPAPAPRAETAPEPEPAPPQAKTRYEMVAEAAYYRAERRGFVGGDPVRDWLEAEREIDAQLHSRQRPGTLGGAEPGSRRNE